MEFGLSPKNMECQWTAPSGAVTHMLENVWLLTAKRIAVEGLHVEGSPDPVVVQETLAASAGSCRGGRIPGIWRWIHLGGEVQGRSGWSHVSGLGICMVTFTKKGNLGDSSAGFAVSFLLKKKKSNKKQRYSLLTNSTNTTNERKGPGTP